MATTDSHTVDNSDLLSEVSAWENKVKEARRGGDPVATLRLAATAADHIEQQVAKQSEWTEDDRKALTAAKRFTYNAAADAWPGWELDGPSSDLSALTAGKIPGEALRKFGREIAARRDPRSYGHLAGWGI